MAIGASLRQAREARGLTVEEVAAGTHIPPHYVEALEAETFDLIPAPVYVRGFIRAYGRFLELDVQPLLDELALGPSPFDPPPPPPLPRPASAPAVEEPGPWEVPEPSAPPSPLATRPRRVISDFDDDWEPEMEPVIRDRASLRLARRARPGHLDGVLVEKEPVDRLKLPDRRLLLLGGAGAVLLVALLVAMLLMRGGGQQEQQLPPSANRTILTTTVIAVVTPTPTPSPSPTASVSPSPLATGTPGASPTGTAPTPSKTP